jgi:tetratricopeptide (TPR) repeat protein
VNQANSVDQAAALMERGGALAAAGRPTDAAAATGESVVIYRRLAAADSKTFAALLASALSDHSANLVDLGRYETARDASGEAVGIYEGLDVVERAVAAPKYARACCNLGWVSLVLGDLDTALTATRDAEQMFRQLAQADPARYERELPTLLTNLTLIWSTLGNADEALASGREALTVARRLADENPGDRAGLARVNLSLSAPLRKVGLSDDATACVHEGVRLYRELARIHPAAYESALAAALVTLTDFLAAAGDHAGALAAAAEARRSLGSLPDRPRRTLETSLVDTLWKLGQGLLTANSADAVPVTTAVTELLRSLASTAPEKYAASLAKALVNQTAAHAAAGDWEGALQAVDAAIALLESRAPADAGASALLASCRQSRDLVMKNRRRPQ